MKIAVWRMGAGFQFAEDSVVGGGAIGVYLVDRLKELGHEVTVLGPAKTAVRERLRTSGYDFEEEPPSLSKFDVCVILTGPFNALYSALYPTYERLAKFEGRVVYAWWDTALPFHFAPHRVKLFASKCKVTARDLERNKSWRIFTQIKKFPSKLPPTALPPFEVPLVECFWELSKLDGNYPELCAEPIRRFAYFGSDRPGRVAEVARWFGRKDSPPCDLYGRWSEKNLKRVSGPSLVFKGPVPELEVRNRLNTYRATLHSADPAYVANNFVAQRFIENAMAGVATAYSDRMQEIVAGVVPNRWVVKSPEDLELWWDVPDSKMRERAEEHRELILGWAEGHRAHPLAVLRLL